MKSFFVVAALVASVLANPLPPPAGAQTFVLYAKSQGKFNNQPISETGPKGGKPKLGGTPAIFWSLPVAQTLRISHQDDSHAYTLQSRTGDGSVLDLIDVIWPSTDTVKATGPKTWDTFAIGAGGELSVKDGVNHPKRQWIAFDDGSIALHDGETPIKESFTKITLTAAQPNRK